jgi:hypothetical protein
MSVAYIVPDTGEGFERYRLVSTVTRKDRAAIGRKAASSPVFLYAGTPTLLLART